MRMRYRFRDKTIRNLQPQFRLSPPHPQFRPGLNHCFSYCHKETLRPFQISISQPRQNWPALCSSEPMAGSPHTEVSDICTRINWDFLLNRTTLYATNHVNRWHWRGSLGG